MWVIHTMINSGLFLSWLNESSVVEKNVSEFMGYLFDLNKVDYIICLLSSLSFILASLSFILAPEQDTLNLSFRSFFMQEQYKMLILFTWLLC